MATKVYEENNLLHIDGQQFPWIKSLTYVEQADEEIIVLKQFNRHEAIARIPTSDFQDGTGAAVGNKDAVITYLSTIIG